MRYTILLILVMAAVSFTGCEQPIDYEKERTAIIAVMEKETQTYIDRDFEGMFSTHVQVSLNMRLSAGADSYVFAEGWEEVSKHMMGDETEDDLGPDLHITVERTNYRMKIYPSSAFVVCDQKWTSQYEDDIFEINSIQVRFLEKIEDEWKISFVSFIGTSGYPDEETEVLFD
ncbi:MAG: hypothetical protein E4H10_11435 [Bacteroidia bacterium]|nr:MAG: hypothetical protein E4H10_11435 [Bacteroidia bacterium]